MDFGIRILCKKHLFANIFKNAKFVKVKDGYHQLFLNDPDKVWNLIKQYF